MNTLKLAKEVFNPKKWVRPLKGEETKKKAIKQFKTEKLLKESKEKVFLTYGHMIHIK